MRDQIKKEDDARSIGRMMMSVLDSSNTEEEDKGEEAYDPETDSDEDVVLKQDKITASLKINLYQDTSDYENITVAWKQN